MLKPYLERVLSSVEPIDEPQVVVELSSAELTEPGLFQKALRMLLVSLTDD